MNPAHKVDFGDALEFGLTVIANYTLVLGGCVLFWHHDYSFVITFSTSFIAAHNNGNAFLKYKLHQRVKELERILGIDPRKKNP